MMNRLLLALVLFIPVKLFAQGTITGKVYDFENKTFPLEGVLVKNLVNSQSVKTRASGSFDLNAKVGDLLEFSLPGFHTDTLFLINLNAKIIYLPANSTSLKEVEILSAKINSSILAPDPNVGSFKRIATDNLDGKKNNDRAGGLKFNLGYGKYKRQQEQIKAYEERDRYEIEINSIFTEEYVHDLVKLKGQDLKDFMSLYRPTATIVKAERPFNYRYYTVQAYHTWLKLPPSQRKLPSSQKLKAD